MNTIKQFKVIFAFAAIITLLVGCEDYLDLDQRGKIPQADFYKTDDDALAAIVAAYDILQNYYAEDWNSAWMVKVLPGDEIVAGGSSGSDNPGFQKLDSLNHSVGNDKLAAVFRNLYFGVYRANVVLENVLDDSKAKKNILGEAYFLRALYYFDLVTMFGDVPLVTKQLTPDEFSMPPNTKAEIWAQIENDLTTAISMLMTREELVAEYDNNHAFRASKGAAQALLGKAYLYQEKFSESATVLDALIGTKEYSLEPDFSSVLKRSTEFGQESLFEVSYSTLEGHTWANGTFIWNNGRRQENNITWQLCGPRFEWFTPGDIELNGGWGFGYAKEELYNDFIAMNDTVRRKATLISDEELLAQGGKLYLTDTIEGVIDTNYPFGYTGYIRLKYGTWADETNNATQAELNYGTNLRVLRYADVLLMAAEAHARKGGSDGIAQGYLNEVRDRVSLDAVSATGTDLFEAIKKERRLEMACEGTRFFDLIRWEDAATVLKGKGFITNKHELFPIPQIERDMNPNLSQNPGWPQ